MSRKISNTLALGLVAAAAGLMAFGNIKSHPDIDLLKRVL